MDVSVDVLVEDCVYLLYLCFIDGIMVFYMLLFLVVDYVMLLCLCWYLVKGNQVIGYGCVQCMLLVIDMVQLEGYVVFGQFCVLCYGVLMLVSDCGMFMWICECIVVQVLVLVDLYICSMGLVLVLMLFVFSWFILCGVCDYKGDYLFVVIVFGFYGDVWNQVDCVIVDQFIGFFVYEFFYSWNSDVMLGLFEGEVLLVKEGGVELVWIFVMVQVLGQLCQEVWSVVVCFYNVCLLELLYDVGIVVIFVDQL